MNVANVARPDQERSESGFSLVEVMIAIIVLVFGIIAVTNLMLVASASNMTGKYATAAVSVAIEELERLKSTPIDSLPGDTHALNDTWSIQRADGGAYQITRVMTPRGPLGPAGLPIAYYIRVSARYIGGFGARTEASFTTFRTTTD